MSSFMNKVKAKLSRGKVAVAGAVAVVGSTSAMAEVSVAGIEFNVGAVETLAAAMLGALALIWVAKKIVNFL